MPEVKRFRDGMRVIVRGVGAGEDAIPIPPTAGTVARLRNADDGAWIRLDARLEVPGAHPFPPDDPRRGCHVIAYPIDCEVVR